MTSLDTYVRQVNASAAFLSERISRLPDVCIMTGTGLSDAAETIDVDACFDYGDIPHFPVSTVTSHTGRLVVGQLAGRPVAAMQGRFHLYEGYSPQAVTFPIRVLRQLGARYLIVTNASGGLNPNFREGDIMVIADHLNLTGANPLEGPNADAWGDRFPDMTRAYDPFLKAAAQQVAAEQGISAPAGVYAGLRGPSLETPAEMRWLRTAGADAVGFSTIQEVIAAVHGGMRVAGLSTITNIADPDAPEVASVDAIIDVATQAAPHVETLIRGVIGAMPHD